MSPISLSICHPVYLSVSLSICQFVHLSVSLSICFSVCRVFVSQSVSLFVYLSVCPFLRLSLSIFLFGSQSVHLSASLSVCLFVFLSICQLECFGCLALPCVLSSFFVQIFTLLYILVLLSCCPYSILLNMFFSHNFFI